MKKKVCKTLHIDENANKEVEEDIVITDEEVADDVKDEVAPADAEEEKTED